MAKLTLIAEWSDGSSSKLDVANASDVKGEFLESGATYLKALWSCGHFKQEEMEMNTTIAALQEKVKALEPAQ